MPAMRTILTALCALVLCSACGAQGANRDELIPRLRDAMLSQVSSQQQNEDNSRLIQEVVESGALEDMTRPEVEQAIGRGDVCSRHERCRENEFDDDDWYYSVGTMGEAYRGGAAPVLIVGFDRSGRVMHVWNLRVH
jgi:hypothetical protein